MTTTIHLGGVEKDELSKAPGTVDPFITVRFTIDAPVFPVAQVAPLASRSDNDDIRLLDNDNNPLTPTAGEFTLLIPAGVSKGHESTRIKIEAIKEIPLDDDPDAPIEDFRFNITELSSTDAAVNSDLVEGWHRRRLILEDTTGDSAAPPGTQSTQCAQICPNACNGYSEGSPNSTVVQIGHATQWTTKDPLVGICPGTDVAKHCQESVKVRAEGGATGHTLHFGYRFKGSDEIGAQFQACGCGWLTAADSLHIQFLISGSAVPAKDPALPDPGEDYILRYSMPNRAYDIPVDNYDPVNGTVVEIDILRGDFGSAGDCFITRTPPGFGLQVITQPNMDDVGVNYEDVVIRTLDMPQAPYIDSDTGDTFGVGWNNVARFIIEEGS
ncbi:MAG: hypothetical protein GY711_03745 [bacterium]|nr:hypothetical protein [bacterium]